MRRGFSLVELSIVLVILGLLTGGILAGQSLIRAAELRTISRDINRYTAATNSFRDKYFMLPGDITNATSFWGDQATGTNSCASAATADGTPGTCNGNGDGTIGAGGGQCSERHRYWQQLAMAGLIEGSYSGLDGASGQCHSVLNTSPPNAAPSRISQAGFSITGVNAMQSAHASYFDGYFSTRFFFGAQNDTLASSMWGPAIKAEDAWNVDTKMDDGKPATGNVTSYKNGATWGTPTCTTTATSASEYAVTVTGNICALMFQVL